MGFFVKSEVQPVYPDIESVLDIARLLLEQGAKRVCIEDESFSAVPEIPFDTMVDFHNRGYELSFPAPFNSYSLFFMLNVTNHVPHMPSRPVLHIKTGPNIDSNPLRGIRLWAHESNAISLEITGDNGVSAMSPTMTVFPDPQGWIPVLIKMSPDTALVSAYFVNNWKSGPELGVLHQQTSFGPQNLESLKVGDVDLIGTVVRVSHFMLFTNQVDATVWAGNLPNAPLAMTPDFVWTAAAIGGNTWAPSVGQAVSVPFGTGYETVLPIE